MGSRSSLGSKRSEVRGRSPHPSLDALPPQAALHLFPQLRPSGRSFGEGPAPNFLQGGVNGLRPRQRPAPTRSSSNPSHQQPWGEGPEVGGAGKGGRGHVHCGGRGREGGVASELRFGGAANVVGVVREGRGLGAAMGVASAVSSRWAWPCAGVGVAFTRWAWSCEGGVGVAYSYQPGRRRRSQAPT